MSGNVRSTPWTRPQLGLVVAAHLLALAAIVAALLGSRSATTLTDQVPWLNLAVVGLVATASAHGCLLLAGRRAVGRRRRTVVPDPPLAVPAASSSPAPVDDWYWTPGTRRAHRPGCALLTGRRFRPVGSAEIRAETLERCELCG